MMRSIFLAALLSVQPLLAINPAAANQQPEAQPATARNDKRAAAPAFALKDLRGRRVRLDDYKGKVILINFWATWCAPCQAEMPELVKLQKQYQARGLQIVGV